MGFKCKMIVGISLVLLPIIFLLIIHIASHKKEDYSTKLTSVLKKQENVTVQEVFSFEFERAYIFNDCYISGEGFAKRYNLDISINEVKTGTSENVQRIVFVDELGDFVYEFKCDKSEVLIPEEGIVIYPETLIERKSSVQEEVLIIGFQSGERYDYSEIFQ